LERIVKTLRFPKILIDEINIVSYKKKLNFTEFITNAVVAYLRELNFTEKISESAGSWNLEKHQELMEGTEEFIRKIRKGREF
jgi:hypothetical protein